MHTRFKNRPPSQSLSDFVDGVSDRLDVDADEVVVYPADNDGGVYTGRDGDSIVIGLGDESEYVTAHEIGHDVFYQVLRDEFPDVDLDFDNEGRITVRGSLNRNDDFDVLVQEVFAENVARSFVGEEETFSRNPLAAVKPHLQAFDDFTRSEPVGSVSSMKEESDGLTYFESPDSIREYDVLRREVGELWNEDKEDIAEIFYNTWWERKRSNTEREDVFQDTVEDYLEIELESPYSSDRDLETVRDTIEENSVWIMKDLRSRLLAKRTRMQIGQGIPPHSDLEEIATSNPDHFSARIQSGELDNMSTDYNHSVGNYIGSRLFDIGVTFEDLLEDEGGLDEISQRGLDLAMEMGKNPEHYSLEDYDQGIRFLAQDIGLAD
ncbi:MAG: hypothetical protein R6V35_03980 [Candidatus Nanohaloarchaea archaeon]